MRIPAEGGSDVQMGHHARLQMVVQMGQMDAQLAQMAAESGQDAADPG